MISTGGSVIYSQAAVARLKELGPLVMLDVDESTFLERVGGAEGRGLAKAPGKTMRELYNERQPLYVPPPTWSCAPTGTARTSAWPRSSNR